MPGVRLEDDARDEAVQERPERVVGVAFVEGARDLRRELDGDVAVLLLPLADELLPPGAALGRGVAGQPSQRPEWRAIRGAMRGDQAADERSLRQRPETRRAVSGRRLETTMSRCLRAMPAGYGTRCRLPRA